MFRLTQYMRELVAPTPIRRRAAAGAARLRDLQQGHPVARECGTAPAAAVVVVAAVVATASWRSRTAKRRRPN